MKTKRKIKKILDYSLVAIVAIFIISLIFVPLRYFSVYINWLLKIGIMLFVVTISMDIFYFAKDTSKRKWNKPKEQDTRRILGIKRKLFFFILEWGALLLLLVLILNVKDGKIGKVKCPDSVSGNIDANLKIKYFFTPFCNFCWKQEHILRDMLQSSGDSFSLERYDIRYCRDESEKYNLMHSSGFVFILKNESKEFPSHGFIDKEAFESIIINPDKLSMHS